VKHQALITATDTPARDGMHVAPPVSRGVAMMCMRLIRPLIRISTSLALMSLCVVGPASGQDRARFRGMDRDGDGVITRAEWRGNDQSFSNHDTNNDGVLSGAEVRAVEREMTTERSQDWRGVRFTDWNENSFSDLDRDRDGRISRGEWPADPDVFAAVDRNRDQMLSRAEFLGLDYGTGVAMGEPTGRDRFDEFDRNHDGIITMNEWPRTELAFHRRDIDGDGAIERAEFPNQRARQDEPAYQRGYERGLNDGRLAGRGDRDQRGQWDLNGQTELERADAGYTSAVGSREDYQAGYRAGFRVGYEQGYNRR
jgi:EF hand